MSLVVLVVCCVMFAVPVTAILILKLGVNRFIHETEQSLIQQGAIYSSAYAAAFEEATRETGGEKMPGYYLPPQKRVFWNARARTFQPLLDLRRDTVLPVRPGAKPVVLTPGPRHLAITTDLELLSNRARRTTLSNVLFLDHKGLDLHADTPGSFAELTEVNEALNGGIGAVLRWRSGAETSSSFIRLNRGTGFRVFVAYPVISENRVIGVVYLSRTPDELGAYLSEEWLSIIVVAAVTAIGAAVLGALLVRQVSRPIMDLRNRARALARGDLENLEHLHRYGTRELAQLGDAVVSMAKTLSERSTEISTYTTHVTHELKAPVTAIISASELLEESSLPDASRRQLLETLKVQGQRMEKLLNQLRDITRLRQQMRGTPAKLVDMLPDSPGLRIITTPVDAILPLSLIHGQTVFAHLAQNAVGHGADQFRIVWRDNVLEIQDNGEGFEDKDMKRLTEPFYTTRRDNGGTGLGLSVVNAILERYDTQIEALPSPGGALFRIAFPIDGLPENRT
ncbi:HAMP domain-containing sensor histidine kinase [uncultured Roseibium sp.]|uniref:sensor histidine kinase n=1 Tax=uncultured Roseibium sp. TaxID=1936171 RepID=UPI00260F415D|nr:HAMP domain-containing sensor histidine kinase [uncultured Roseibium sp.]